MGATMLFQRLTTFPPLGAKYLVECVQVHICWRLSASDFQYSLCCWFQSPTGSINLGSLTRENCYLLHPRLCLGHNPTLQSTPSFGAFRAKARAKDPSSTWDQDGVLVSLVQDVCSDQDSIHASWQCLVVPNQLLALVSRVWRSSFLQAVLSCVLFCACFCVEL